MKMYSIVDLMDMNNSEIEKLERTLSNEKIDLILEQFKEYLEYRSPEEEFLHDYLELRNSWLELGHETVHQDLLGFRDTIYACYSEDWESCRSYLESYFSIQTPEMIKQLNISQWDYRHILTWFRMLINTDLYKEPDGTPVRTFFLMVLKEGTIIRPSKLRAMFESEVKQCCSGLFALEELTKDMIQVVK